MKKLSKVRTTIANTMLFASRALYLGACEVAGRDPRKAPAPPQPVSVAPDWEEAVLASDTVIGSNVVELEGPPKTVPRSVRLDTETSFEIRPVLKVEGSHLVLDCQPAVLYPRGSAVRLYGGEAR